MSNYFPEMTDSFLAGQDLFYYQFNDVSFYVEDTDQEHLYFNILKKLFPDIRLDKIFPLNGKGNLKDHAQLHIGDKKKVYLADLDFDEILGIKEDIDNVFYLKRYSIENYLFEQDGIFELIREKNPKLQNNEINELFNYDNELLNCKMLLSELACGFVVIQKYSLGKEYFGMVPPRDFDFKGIKPAYRNEFIVNYFNEIEVLLKSIDQRFTFNSKKNKFKSHFSSKDKALQNIPGKYLLSLLKFRLVGMNLITDVSDESFTYKLGKECNLSSMNYLKTEIIAYMN